MSYSWAQLSAPSALKLLFIEIAANLLESGNQAVAAPILLRPGDNDNVHIICI